MSNFRNPFLYPLIFIGSLFNEPAEETDNPSDEKSTHEDLKIEYLRGKTYEWSSVTT